MLNRRYLRIKVMQAIYAFFHSDNSNLASAEKELFQSIEKIHILFYYVFSLIPEITDYAQRVTEEAKLKYRPSEEEINPNLRFVNSKFSRLIQEDTDYKLYLNNYKINWIGEGNLILRILNEIKVDKQYIKFMSLENYSDNEDLDLWIHIIKKHIATNEVLKEIFEEKSIYWVDDWEFINIIIAKTIELHKDKELAKIVFPPLYKDEDDKDFVKELFRKCVVEKEKFITMISSKTQNWEMDRIASMDIILMSMALCEMLEFTSIPVKVSLNEYIEISKEYSTPKSKIFINGILDKLVIELRGQKKITKTGRGLME